MRTAGVVLGTMLVVLGPMVAESAAEQGDGADHGEQSLLIVIPVDFEEEVQGALILGESIRRFGAELSDVPVRVYVPAHLGPVMAERKEEFSEHRLEIREVEVPQDAFRYFLGAKPFTTAQAEREAEGVDLLAVMAPNTIVLRAPEALLLPEEASLGYSTVHHQNVGSLASEPPDPFWRRVYSVLKVPEERMFTNQTLADQKTVRFYFNAGSFVVRPDRRLLQAWADGFQQLYQDPEMADLCREGLHNVFLHQAALAGVALARFGQKDVVELPDAYSYPLFFEKFHGGELTFDSLEGVVTMRYEFRVADLPEGWEKEVKGSPEVLTWIRGRLEASGG
jgi:hypothetical protein